jgi:hypothetical protein
MFTKSSDKSMPEYRIAIKICKELKYIATELASANPRHRFGRKFIISRAVYNSIINSEIEAKKLSITSSDKVRKFIEQKLEPA